jgi:hypothetical protein
MLGTYRVAAQLAASQEGLSSMSDILRYDIILKTTIRTVTIIFYRIEPLLCNDCEMGGYTMDVSGQRLGKHVPAATDTHATMAEQ